MEGRGRGTGSAGARGTASGSAEVVWELPDLDMWREECERLCLSLSEAVIWADWHKGAALKVGGESGGEDMFSGPGLSWRSQLNEWSRGQRAGKQKDGRRQSQAADGSTSSSGSRDGQAANKWFANVPLDSLGALSIRFSATACLRAAERAVEAYKSELPPLYLPSEHAWRLRAALKIFLSSARGPAVTEYEGRVVMVCEGVWRGGRRQCEAVSVTGWPCRLPRRHHRRRDEAGEVESDASAAASEAAAAQGPAIAVGEIGMAGSATVAAGIVEESSKTELKGEGKGRKGKGIGLRGRQGKALGHNSRAVCITFCACGLDFVAVPDSFAAESLNRAMDVSLPCDDSISAVDLLTPQVRSKGQAITAPAAVPAESHAAGAQEASVAPRAAMAVKAAGAESLAMSLARAGAAPGGVSPTALAAAARGGVKAAVAAEAVPPPTAAPTAAQPAALPAAVNHTSPGCDPIFSTGITTLPFSPSPARNPTSPVDLPMPWQQPGVTISPTGQVKIFILGSSSWYRHSVGLLHERFLSGKNFLLPVHLSLPKLSPAHLVDPKAQLGFIYCSPLGQPEKKVCSTFFLIGPERVRSAVEAAWKFLSEPQVGGEGAEQDGGVIDGLMDGEGVVPAPDKPVMLMRRGPGGGKKDEKAAVGAAAAAAAAAASGGGALSAAEFPPLLPRPSSLSALGQAESTDPTGDVRAILRRGHGGKTEGKDTSLTPPLAGSIARDREAKAGGKVPGRYQAAGDRTSQQDGDESAAGIGRGRGGEGGVASGVVTVTGYVGFEYACPMGHRWMSQVSAQVAAEVAGGSGGNQRDRERERGGKVTVSGAEDSEHLLSQDMPLLMACPGCQASRAAGSKSVTVKGEEVIVKVEDESKGDGEERLVRRFAAKEGDRGSEREERGGRRKEKNVEGGDEDGEEGEREGDKGGNGAEGEGEGGGGGVPEGERRFFTSDIARLHRIYVVRARGRGSHLTVNAKHNCSAGSTV